MPGEDPFSLSGGTVQPSRSRRRGFTLVEVLVVIGVIGILASILLVAVFKGKGQARVTYCLNNLRQLALSLEMYRADHKDKFPTWLASLWPTYTNKDRRIFVCSVDLSKGAEGGRPDWIEFDQFPNADKDGPVRMSGASGENWFPSSYLYEFNGEECEWCKPTGAEKDFYDRDGDGVVSWYEAKIVQVLGGSWTDEGGSLHKIDPKDVYNGRVPVIRCFWHADKANGLEDTDRVLNICYNYRIYMGRPEWEKD
jgi:prepilin-type N-terminal cleavage/methylation domain-containing protein